jgi:hypothetical protein
MLDFHRFGLLPLRRVPFKSIANASELQKEWRGRVRVGDEKWSDWKAKVRIFVRREGFSKVDSHKARFSEKA